MTGTRRSAVPCHSVVGTATSLTSKPQGLTLARSSSIHPSAPSRKPSRKLAARSSAPSSVMAARSASQNPSPMPAIRSAAVAESICARASSAAGRSAASPCKARPNPSTLSLLIPARKSRPSRSIGGGARDDQERGDAMWEASATGQCPGPPPEAPTTRQRPTPRKLITASVSAATSATLRPGWRVDSPYPGRHVVTKRSPSVCAVSTRLRSGLPGCALVVEEHGTRSWSAHEYFEAASVGEAQKRSRESYIRSLYPFLPA